METSIDVKSADLKNKKRYKTRFILKIENVKKFSKSRCYTKLIKASEKHSRVKGDQMF